MNQEFDKVRKKAEQELMAIPGVIAVGVGLKEVKGDLKRELCFKVTVQRKKPESELQSTEKIPDTIYGFKTDVNEISTGTDIVNSNKYRPLIGGSQLGCSTDSGIGTLGCFAKRNADNKIVLLTNWHVAVGNADNINGDKVGQPSHNGCCSCCACNEIGIVTDGRLKTDNLDAAIALLDGQESDTIPDVRYLNEVLEIGLVAGSAAPVAGETVSKYGRTTGFTKGVISNDNGGTNLVYDSYGGITINRAGQLIIAVEAPFATYVDKGDSGSVSLNEKNQVIGLNYGKSGTSGFANNIVNVIGVLNISILDSSFHPSLAGKEGIPLSSTALPYNNTGLAESMAALESELMVFSEGRRVLNLFKKHRSEVLNLVNKNREVMAAWNRYQGPAYLANIARSIRRENKPVPDNIKGITLHSLLLKMTAVLQRNGSPELAREVSENYLPIINVLSAGNSPEEWKAYLAKSEQLSNF